MVINQELLEWVLADLKDLSPSGQRLANNGPFVELLDHGDQLEGEAGQINAWKAAFQAYLATIAWSDQNIGILVDAISKHPHQRNTVILLWSDHGYHIGDKHREGKVTPWEAANHCNLMILDPRSGETHAGRRTAALSSLQDLYPTVVSLAGLERPDHVSGQDLSPLLIAPDMSWKHDVLNTMGEQLHALRTDRYRYIRFQNGDEELYDLQEDPMELTNLASLPESEALLGGLRKRLRERLEE